MRIEFAGKVHEVEITYKRIKNMYLRVDAEGILHVSCSRRVSKKQIEDFILSREDWILKTQRKQEKREEKSAYGLNGSAAWLGKLYYTDIIVSSKASMKIDGDHMILHVRENTPEEIQRVFYYYGAKKVASLIEEKRNEWDQKICRSYGRNLPDITVRYMTGRWGSCTAAKGTIRISSRLIHFPEECLNYVLLHEYVHLLVQNHSSSFYAYVESFMPEYRYYENMLK